MKNIFLTGPMKVGKTTILNRVLSSPHLSEMLVGGYRTVPQLENGRVCGYTITGLDGQGMLFAHEHLNGLMRFDRFHLDISVFNQVGVRLLEDAIREAELVFMDEIGIMEENARDFLDCVNRCLDSQKRVLGAVQQRAKWFFDLIVPRADTIILEVTENNRNNIYEAVLALIKIDNKSKKS